MSEQQELKLAEDLIRLLKKYGPEPFEKLALLTSSPEVTAKLSEFLNGMADSARAIQGQSKTVQPKIVQPKTPTVREVLSLLESNEPEKYTLLEGFQNDVLTGTILPTMREIRSFALECGLAAFSPNSRQKAISPLIRYLSNIPLNELKHKIQFLNRYDKQGRDLEGWSEIILDKERRPKNP